MAQSTRDRTPHLRVVEGRDLPDAANSRDTDWSILMARAQDGDRDAYRRLLGEIAPYLRAIAARHHRDGRDVEDSVQDTLLTLHAIRHTYDPARPFTPWLVAIARRRIIDRLRQQGRARIRDAQLAADHETFAVSGANNTDATVDERTLHLAIRALPPRQREAVTLLKLRELSLKEASTVSGVSISALKLATHRAMKTLRKRLLDWSKEK
jgi:RNA polymerase sigma-70 factor (ECF subfamily)